MALSKQDIAEKIDEGAIRCIVSVQVVGKPKEHVNKSVGEYVSLLEKEKSLHVLEKETFPAEELEDQEGYFSGLAEVELIVPGLEALTQLSFNLTPASIEILEPNNFELGALDVQNWVNDMLAMLHSVSTTLRGERQRANHLNSAVLRLSKNLVTIVLTSGAKNLSVLKRMTGLEEEALEKVLAAMEKDKTITKKGEQWILKSSEK